MRYRPFGATGAVISNLTFSLGIDAVARGPEATSELIYAALEAGINSYRLESADSVLAEAVGQALSNVDRALNTSGLSAVSKAQVRVELGDLRRLDAAYARVAPTSEDRIYLERRIVNLETRARVRR